MEIYILRKAEGDTRTSVQQILAVEGISVPLYGKVSLNKHFIHTTSS